MPELECIICGNPYQDLLNKVEQRCPKQHIVGEVVLCINCLANAKEAGADPAETLFRAIRITQKAFVDSMTAQLLSNTTKRN